jgi:Ca2+-binding EF-hand superfamily protein
MLVVQAKELLELLDEDHDGKVSQAEWLTTMSTLTEHLRLVTFHQVLCTLLHSTMRTVHLDPSQDCIQHPINNTMYLSSTVSRHLQKGLAAIFKQMADRHTNVASGKLWTADGYLPAKYLPGRPARMLGEWLRDNNPYTVPLHDDPRELNWSESIPWPELSLLRKFKIVFHHLDEHQTGWVGVPEVLDLVTSFPGIITREQAQARIAAMDMSDNHDMDLEEFLEYMSATMACTDAATQALALLPIVCGYFLSMRCPRQQFGYAICHSFLYGLHHLQGFSASVICTMYVCVLARQPTKTSIDAFKWPHDCQCCEWA